MLSGSELWLLRLMADRGLALLDAGTLLILIEERGELRVAASSGEETPRGKNSDQTFFAINREKINDALAYAFPPDLFERLSDRHAGIEQRKIFSRVLDDERIEIRTAGAVRHPQLLLDERCLCSLEFVPLR